MILEVMCQLSRDVIGYKRLIMSLVCFDPSSVTVKLLFIVSQIVGCHSLTTTYFLDGDVFKSALIPYLGKKISILLIGQLKNRSMVLNK